MSAEFPQLAAIRLGFGLSPLMPPPQSVEAVLDGVANARPGPEALNADEAGSLSSRLAELGKARKTGTAGADEEYRALNQKLSQFVGRDVQRRLVRAVDDPTGFGERLVQFWSNHFTVGPKGPAQYPLALAFVDEAIRPHLTGRFEDMFFAAETHPMMLIYLDQISSRGPNSPFALKRRDKGFGLNENLAREAMELHSMGVGAPYTQKDVHELAELLTGLSYTAKNGFSFNPNIAEPGAETVLGVRYGGMRRGGLDDIRTALRDIARRPETAQYVSRKLAVHFVSDQPSDGLLQAMGKTWHETDGHLTEVYRTMIRHPDLAANLRGKVRQPFDFMATAFRALGVTGDQLAGLEFPMMRAQTLDPLTRMGQLWLRPTGPNGWPEDAQAWIAPQLLAARITWSMQMPSKMVDPLPDPRDLMQTAFGGTQSEALAWAVPKAESQAEGVALVLASNDFNRR